MPVEGPSGCGGHRREMGATAIRSTQLSVRTTDGMLPCPVLLCSLFLLRCRQAAPRHRQKMPRRAASWLLCFKACGGGEVPSCLGRGGAGRVAH